MVLKKVLTFCKSVNLQYVKLFDRNDRKEFVQHLLIGCAFPSQQWRVNSNNAVFVTAFRVKIR